MTIGVGDRIGPYEILAPLGAGGMGEVYRARDAKLNRDVAIKVLPELFSTDPDRLARFRREAQVLASLNHQNIGHIYGLEDASGVHALVLELVEGPTLADRIAPFDSAQGRHIPFDEAISIARQIADALECAHEQGIIHRDLKPANIKVRPDGTVKVLDFGLAKALDTVSTSSPDAMNSPTITARGTQLGLIVGTAAYMSPEQARGRPVDRRADIWAFGVVLYEMLAGKRAFEGDDVSITLASVLKDDVEWKALPGALPPSVQRLLRRCLEKDPRRRLSAIGDARLELDAALQPSTEDQEAPRTPPSRLWRRFAYLAVLVIGAVLGGVAVWSQRPVPPQAARIEFGITQPFQSNPFVLSLSPDGRTLAYLARETAAAPSKVWVRSLDNQAARSIDGTDAATYMFWSPDGRRLAFTANNRLKVVEAAGGTAVELCNVASFAGGTWGRDDTILFSDSRDLLRISARGGAPAAVFTPSDPTTQRAVFPSFLPDGRFLYLLARRPTADDRAVHIASFEDLPGRRIIEADSAAVYASGHLFYVRNGVLTAHPFDAGSGSSAGEPLELMSGIATAPNVARAAFTAGGVGTIAFRRGRETPIMLRVRVFDRAGKPVRELGEPGAIRQIRLSPDARRLALERRDLRPVSDISTMDVTTGISTRLTFHEAGVVDPVWSPDSRRVAYGTPVGPKTDILVAAVGDTKGQPLVTSSEPIKYVDDWSRDGRLVIFHDNSGREAYAAEAAAGQTARKLASESHPIDSIRVSPDGRRVAFQAHDASSGEVFVADFPSFARRTQVSSAGGAMPRWRSDGRELFYVAPTRMVMAVPVGNGTEPTFGLPVALFEAPIPRTMLGTGLDLYDPTPDGSRFFVISEDSDRPTEVPPITVVVNWLSGLAKK